MVELIKKVRKQIIKKCVSYCIIAMILISVGYFIGNKIGYDATEKAFVKVYDFYPKGEYNCVKIMESNDITEYYDSIK